MLSVSNAVKTAYQTEGNAKTYTLLIDGITYTGSNITSDLEYTDSLCSGENLDFASVEKNSIKFTLINYGSDNYKILVGKTCIVTSSIVNETVPYGYFVIKEVTKNSDNTISITAYDYLDKFDISADDWWNNQLTFPTTPRDALISLCTYCGVQYDIPVAYPNSALSIAQPTVNVSGTTGLDFLSQMQEVCFRFFKIDRSNGKLHFVTFYNYKTLVPYVGLYPRTGLYPGSTSSDIPSASYTGHDYRGYVKNSDYSTDLIDKLQIHDTETDIGAVVGTGTNAYVVTGNYFFKGLDASALNTCAQALYSEINDITYMPFEADVYGLPYIEAGDIIAIKTPKGDLVKSIILSRTLSGTQMLVDALSSKGSKTRTSLTSVNKVIKSVNKRTLEIAANVDELSTTLTDSTANLQSQITQQAGEITLKVSSDSIISAINLSPELAQISGERVKIDTTTMNLTFGSDTSSITIKATDSDDGVLFTGNGVIDFNSIAMFNAVNVNTQTGYNGSILRLYNSSFTGNKNNFDLVNYKLTKTDSVYDNSRANAINLIAAAASGSGNATRIKNYQYSSTGEGNQIIMNATGTANSISVYNYLLGATTLVNGLSMNCSSSGSSVTITNKNLSGNVATQISLEHRSSSEYFSVYNNDISTHDTANYIQIQGNSDGSHQFWITNNKYQSTSTANQIYMYSTSSSTSLQIVNSQAGNSVVGNSIVMTSNSGENPMLMITNYQNASSYVINGQIVMNGSNTYNCQNWHNFTFSGDDRRFIVGASDKRASEIDFWADAIYWNGTKIYG